MNNVDKIFKKVGVGEAKSLLKKALQSEIDILGKSLEHEVYVRTKGGELLEDTALLLKIVTKDETLVDEEIIFNFTLDAQKYFFQTKVQKQEGFFVVPLEVELFHLQRRAYIRVGLPTRYKAFFNILNLQGKGCFLECPIRDVGAGGVKIEIPEGKLALQVGDVLSGVLRLSFRNGINLKAEVRAVGEDKGKITAGIQFIEMNNFLESKLLTVVMGVQRELNNLKKKTSTK